MVAARSEGQEIALQHFDVNAADHLAVRTDRLATLAASAALLSALVMATAGP